MLKGTYLNEFTVRVRLIALGLSRIITEFKMNPQIHMD